MWKQVTPGSKPSAESKNSATEKSNQMDSKKEPEKTNSGTSDSSSGSPSPPVRLKYEMCKNFKETGSCKYGDRCMFAHGDHELINRGPAIAAASSEKSKTSDSNETDPKQEKKSESKDDE